MDTYIFYVKMENLQSLMRCLDDISKMIPEGTYLEMCDNLKKVHDTIPKRVERRVPFMPVQPTQIIDDSDSETESDDGDEPWNPEWYDEWSQNEEALRRLLADLKVAKTVIRVSKPIQRITKSVRESAMKHFATYNRIFDYNVFYVNQSADGVHAEATFENYVRLMDWSEFSEQERKELTSKKFEKKIYNDYKMFENDRIETKKNEALELKRNLEIEIDDIRERQNYLRVHYNL
jgi:hypothetical protein